MEESFYTIGDVSAKTGVKPYILRYWEKEFPYLQPMKNRVGHRLYSRRDLFIIMKIKELLYEKGYSIPGAKKLLWEMLLGKHRSLKLQYLEEIRKELKEMLNAIEKNLLL